MRQHGTTARFLSDQRGVFAIMFGAVVAILALAIGFAANTAQLYNVKSSLSQALDAAVTSTARDLTTGAVKPEDAQARVELFLKANGDPELAPGEKLVLNSLVVDKTAKTVAAEAYVDVALFFPLFWSGDVRRVSAESAAIYSDKHVEIAMMLDVTKSMEKKGGVDKIGDLRTAATNAVNTVLKNQDPKNPRVRVALVPYASGVNVGDLSDNVYAETSSSSNLPPVAGSKDIKDKTGKNSLPSFSEYKTIVAAAYKQSDTCATERKDKNGKPDLTADAPDTVRKDKNGKEYYALVNRDDHFGSGMNACPDAAVIPLTADSKTLLDSIGTFKANGYTAGAIAIQWTYYMLSQNWRPAIKSAGLGDGPADHNAKKISKVAILMTDGQFNTVFAGVSSDFNSQGTKSRDSAEGICANMKTAGIEIYTIGFDLNNKDMKQAERDAAKGVLKNCASKDSGSIKHYFEASTGTELDAAFQEIISNTERLALTQ